jgi:hypothetical protein
MDRPASGLREVSGSGAALSALRPFFSKRSIGQDQPGVKDRDFSPLVALDPTFSLKYTSVVFYKSSLFDEFVKSRLIVIPDLIRDPELVETTRFRPSPE